MIQPIGDKVLIKIKKNAENKTASGIVLTEELMKEDKGEIVAMGAKVDQEEIKKGDIVIFDDHGGERIKESEEAEFLILSYNKIIAKII